MAAPLELLDGLRRKGEPAALTTKSQRRAEPTCPWLRRRGAQSGFFYTRKSGAVIQKTYSRSKRSVL